MIFARLIGFLAAQVWNDAARASAAVNREASALRGAVVLAAGGRLVRLRCRHGDAESTPSGGAMPALRLTLTLILFFIAAPLQVHAQSATVPDSASAQIRLVLRAFYLNLSQQNWDALAAYVLSPKLLERRGAPGDIDMIARDRTRGRETPAAAPAPDACPSSASPMIGEAVIGIDGDWADVSVPRCSGSVPGVDRFGMLYFERRWRFIYTDLFQASPAPATAAR